MTEELGTETETEGKVLDRRKRYRKKPTTKTPLSVYFNMDAVSYTHNKRVYLYVDDKLVTTVKKS